MVVVVPFDAYWSLARREGGRKGGREGGNMIEQHRVVHAKATQAVLFPFVVQKLVGVDG
jgi:hypothetical protein